MAESTPPALGRALEGRHRKLLEAALLATLIHLVPSTASAYDLSRGFERARPAVAERVFIDALVGAWLPGPLTFNDNHTVSPNFAGEVGVKILGLREHFAHVVFGFSFSPQDLEPHLEQESTNMLQGFGGLRYTPGMLCMGSGAGCPFLEVSLGLTWDTADAEAGHAGPAGDWTLNFGGGYRFHLGSVLHLGLRIDASYLEEDRTSQIGWLIPSAFAGLRF